MTTTPEVLPASSDKHTGRIVALLSLLVGFVGAVAPLALNMDVSSAAGIVAGLVAVSAVAVKYLDGWQKYEARLDGVVAGGAGLVTVASTGAPAPLPPVDDPEAGPEPAGVDGGTDEPDAPRAGEPEDPLEGIDGDEIPDVPDPPTEDEVAAVNAELQQVPAAGAPTAANGRG